MVQGLFAAASGIRANQLAIDVVANNIANVNTTSFKSSKANFANVFLRTFTGGSLPTSAIGGTNPMQLGSGVNIAEIAVNHNQGGTQFTGRASDVLVNGEGYFVIQNSSSQSSSEKSTYFTRAGNFTLDAQGSLVTSSGNSVIGSSRINGTSPQSVDTIRIPRTMTVAKYYDANDNIKTSVLGKKGAAASDFTTYETTNSISYPKRVISTVDLVNFSINNGGSILATYSNGDRLTVRNNPDATTNSMELIHSPNEGGTFSAINPSGASGKTGQLTGANQLLATPAGGGDPLTGMNFQLQMASFGNKNGLEAIANNGVIPSANSGDISYGLAGTNGKGALQAGSLETSNVDMASEFSNLTIAQRALEASSRLIRAESEALQSIIQAV
ncbi:MAG: flagellar hook-basal body complex protein [Vampirovibrionales bacterium]